MKKLLLIAPVFALAFILTFAPALASNHGDDRNREKKNTVDLFNYNEAFILNKLSSFSNSGFNTIELYNEVDPAITTGAASSAVATDSRANFSDISVTPLSEEDPIFINNLSNANVVNDLFANANTGYNLITNGDESTSISTGEASSSASAVSLVNSSVIRVNSQE